MGQVIDHAKSAALGGNQTYKASAAPLAFRCRVPVTHVSATAAADRLLLLSVAVVILGVQWRYIVVTPRRAREEGGGGGLGTRRAKHAE